VSGRLGGAGGATVAETVAQHPGKVVPSRRRHQVVSIVALAALAGAGAVAFALLVVLFLLGTAGGCADGKEPAANTGGHDGGSDNGHGVCWWGSICAGNAVRSCDQDGILGDVVQSCGTGACSYGRCVSSSCQMAEIQPSINGCLFYTTMLDNVDSDDVRPSLIIITNPGQGMAMVRLEERSAGQPWTTVQSTAVAGGSAGGITVGDRHIEETTFGLALARRVVSDTPVTVMIVQSDDADRDATSSSGTMLLPFHALGYQYMTMSYQQSATPEMVKVAGALGGAAEIAIVATQDRTLIQIWPPGAPRGAMSMSFSLNDGDVYQKISLDDLDDLAGTTILADKPVAVFSGNVTTTYGRSSTGINSPDMAMEQMVPSPTWSRSYVAAYLPPQVTVCDSLFAGGSTGYWRLLAAENASVTFSSAMPLPLELTMPMHVTRGNPFPVMVPAGTDFVVHADQPILLTQGMDCEPTLSSAIPADAPASQQVFALAPNFDHVLAIARKTDSKGSRVTLDDTDITAQFTPVADGFEVARVHVPICYGSVDHCVHRLIGAYGLTLRGMDVACSYATTYPTWLHCTDVCP
jgi:hypothetical protein